MAPPRRHRPPRGKVAFLIAATAASAATAAGNSNPMATHVCSFVAPQRRRRPSSVSAASDPDPLVPAIGSIGGSRRGRDRGEPIEGGVQSEGSAGTSQFVSHPSSSDEPRRMRRRSQETASFECERAGGFFAALRSAMNRKWSRLRRRRVAVGEEDGVASSTSSASRLLRENDGGANEAERKVNDGLRVRMKHMIEEAKRRVVVNDAMLRRPDVIVDEGDGDVRATAEEAEAEAETDDDSWGRAGGVESDASGGGREHRNHVRELKRRMAVNGARMRAVGNEIALEGERVVHATRAHEHCTDGNDDTDAGVNATSSTLLGEPANHHHLPFQKNSRIEPLRLAAAAERNPDERRRLLAYLEVLKIESEVDDRIDSLNELLVVLREANEDSARRLTSMQE